MADKLYRIASKHYNVAGGILPCDAVAACYVLAAQVLEEPFEECLGDDAINRQGFAQRAVLL